ncbi:MAG: hypothetical protein ACLUFI_12195 [Oscillospiraceae bacterium]
MTRCHRAAWFFPVVRGHPTTFEENNEEKVLVWVLAAVLLLSMVGCSAANVSSTNDQYVGMEPAAAAEAAAAETKDTASLSDIIRVPFGFLLDWLYMFTNNYGLALILFSSSSSSCCCRCR